MPFLDVTDVLLDPDFVDLTLVCHRQVQTVSETIPLNLKICLAVLQFFFHRYQIFHLTDRVPEKCRQSLRHIRYTVKTGNKCLTAYTLQCIVQKMRIDLILQG